MFTSYRQMSEWRAGLFAELAGAPPQWFVEGGLEDSYTDNYEEIRYCAPSLPYQVKVVERRDSGHCRVLPVDFVPNESQGFGLCRNLSGVFDTEEAAMTEYKKRRAAYSVHLLQQAMETIDSPEIKNAVAQAIENLKV